MPCKTWIFTSSPLAKDDVRLGSLVPDIRYPHMDALSIKELESEKDFSNNLDQNFEGRLNSEANLSFSLALTTLFSAIFQKVSSEEWVVRAGEGRIYELRKPKDIFKELCKNKETQKWLQEGYVDKQETYMVIGYRTLVNAKLVRQENRSRNASGQLSLPTEALTGAPLLPKEANIALSVGASVTLDAKGDIETIGERIYAICFRKVGIKFHGGIQTPRLEGKNIWKSFTIRGTMPTEDEIIEADIANEDEEAVGKVLTFEVAGGTEVFIKPTEEETAIYDEEGETDEE